MKPARVQTSIYQYFESKINQSEVEQDTDVQYLGNIQHGNLGSCVDDRLIQ